MIAIILIRGLAAGKEFYTKRPAHINILEYVINEKGYALLSQKNYEKAIALFAMNTYAFPKSANAYDSLGEAFMNNGEKQLAIRNYEISLKLNPNNGNAKDMLDVLHK